MEVEEKDSFISVNPEVTPESEFLSCLAPKTSRNSSIPTLEEVLKNKRTNGNLIETIEKFSANPNKRPVALPFPKNLASKLPIKNHSVSLKSPREKEEKHGENPVSDKEKEKNRNTFPKSAQGIEISSQVLGNLGSRIKSLGSLNSERENENKTQVALRSMLASKNPKETLDFVKDNEHFKESLGKNDSNLVQNGKEPSSTGASLVTWPQSESQMNILSLKNQQKPSVRPNSARIKQIELNEQIISKILEQKRLGHLQSATSSHLVKTQEKNTRDSASHEKTNNGLSSAHVLKGFQPRMFKSPSSPKMGTHSQRGFTFRSKNEGSGSASARESHYNHNFQEEYFFPFISSFLVPRILTLFTFP